MRSPSIPKSEPLKWDGVSYINNIEYSKDCMKVKREYGIGEGKILKWSALAYQEKFHYQTSISLKPLLLQKSHSRR